MIYDTHCHPNLSKKKQTDSIINEFFRENTEGYINLIGTNLEDSKDIINISKTRSNTYCTIGIHPTDSLKYKGKLNKTIDKLEELYLKNKNKVVAIGECGLDYYWIDSLKKEYGLKKEEIINIQKEFFVAQIGLAKKYNLPIVIHNRESKDDIYDILIKTKCKNFIFHCYTENLEYAQKLISHSQNCKISFSGIITFNNANEIQETAKSIKLKNILIETDSPFLTPVPLRGKEENEPLFVKYVLQKIIELRNEDASEIKKQIFKNSLETFF